MRCATSTALAGAALTACTNSSTSSPVSLVPPKPTTSNTSTTCSSLARTPLAVRRGLSSLSFSSVLSGSSRQFLAPCKRDEPETAFEPVGNTTKASATSSSELVAPSETFRTKARISSKEQYDEMYKRSVEDPGAFWSEIAEEFHWEKKWDPSNAVSANFDVREGPISIEWFKGGTTNICYNALDRWIEKGKGDKVAFLWEGNDVGVDSKMTYKEVKDEVCKLANYLKNECGVKAGDRVVIYLPMLNELPIAMLACARIGAIHSVVFGGFSAEALAQRVVDSKATAVLTCNSVKRGAKLIALKNIVDEALELCKEENYEVKHVLCYNNTYASSKEETAMVEGRDVWWQDAVAPQSTECDVVWMDAEAPLFMLYTSGSTGKPKGVLHTTGGYMVYAATTFKHAFDFREDDVYWCTADCGWITGHTYLAYGPLLNGGTNVVFEGVPTYPDAGRCWAIVDKYKVNSFYTAPTAIRALQRSGNAVVKKYDRSSLRILGTVGEPINPEAWRWYYEVVGDSRCPIVDTWWQTETAGHMILPIPGAVDMKPGSASLPFFGVQVAIVDEKGQELEGACEGYLCIKEPWPSTMRTIYGDQARFETAYFAPFKGYYFSGDGARRDADGYYWITGRVDDVINVSGHRIGTAEVESALVLHPKCAEAAVVGVEHPIKGQAVYAFATLMEGEEYTDDLKTELKGEVRKHIGAFASPDTIHWAPGLPKTRSGKIMRRILRKIASKELDSLGDTSTLADPGIVDTLISLTGK